MTSSPLLSQKSSARLVVGDGAERRLVDLAPLPFTMGRSSDRSLSLADPQVSREHAFIDRDGDGYFLRDMGSRHGTSVNGMRVEDGSTRLRSGDRIVLGSAGGPLVFELSVPENRTQTLLAQLSPAGFGNQDLGTLSLLLEAAQSLNSDGGLDEVLHTMLDCTLRLTHAERGFVFLGSTAEGLTLRRGLDSAGNDLTEHGTISHSIVRDAVGSRMEFILGDVAGEAATVGRESLIVQAIRSVVAIPLRGRHSERLLGLLYLDSRSATHDFSSADKGTLLVIARQAATLLENLRMLEAEREAALLRKELEIAASIQRQIIPRTLPQFAGVRLSARTVPSTGVGGDFYDVIATPGGFVAGGFVADGFVADGFVAIVADVSGKGVPAALLASLVQGMVHAQITSGASLVDTVNCVNKLVCSRAGAMYVTLAMVRYGGAGEVELINGGHISPLVVRGSGAVEVITEGDMPVGLLEIATFHSIRLRLGPGERMVLLSDGISETEDAGGTAFSEAELGRAVMEPDAVEAVFTAIERFSGGAPALDDRTVLAIERVA